MLTYLRMYATTLPKTFEAEAEAEGVALASWEPGTSWCGASARARRARRTTWGS